MITLFTALLTSAALGIVLALVLHILEHPLGLLPRYVWIETAAGVLISFAIVLAFGDAETGFHDTIFLFAVAFIGQSLVIVPWQTWLYWNNKDRRLS